MNEKNQHRVLLLDDDMDHLLTLKEHLVTAIENRPDLFGEKEPIIATESDAGKVERQILSNDFHYDIIIADVFMPLDPTKSSTPHVKGGALRIYEAIKKERLYANPLLVTMSNRRSDAATELRQVNAEQGKLDIPWVITHYAKPKSTPSDCDTEGLVRSDDWTHAIARAIKKCENDAWKKTWVKGTLLDIIGDNPAILKAKMDVARFADKALVCILAPTGSGKQIFANAIHRNSTHPKGSKCIRVNLQNLNLVESELFGHEKGAFTHATSQSEGAFGLSKNGTVILDEFGSDFAKAVDIEPKLRHILRERTYRRVGGSEDIPFNGTVILMGSRLGEFLESTHCKLDFQGRVTSKPTITLPALREMPECIIHFAEHFLAKYSSRRTRPLTLSKDVKKALMEHEWPGNIAELESVMKHPNVCEKIVSSVIEMGDLHRVLNVEVNPPMSKGPQQLKSTDITKGVDLTDAELVDVFVAHNGNRTDAARALGVSLPTFRKYLGRIEKENPDLAKRIRDFPAKGGRPRKFR